MTAATVATALCVAPLVGFNLCSGVDVVRGLVAAHLSTATATGTTAATSSSAAAAGADAQAYDAGLDWGSRNAGALATGGDVAAFCAGAGAQWTSVTAPDADGAAARYSAGCVDGAASALATLGG